MSTVVVTGADLHRCYHQFAAIDVVVEFRNTNPGHYKFYSYRFSKASPDKVQKRWGKINSVGRSSVSDFDPQRIQRFNDLIVSRTNSGYCLHSVVVDGVDHYRGGVATPADASVMPSETAFLRYRSYATASQVAWKMREHALIQTADALIDQGVVVTLIDVYYQVSRPGTDYEVATKALLQFQDEAVILDEVFHQIMPVPGEGDIRIEACLAEFDLAKFKAGTPIHMLGLTRDWLVSIRKA